MADRPARILFLARRYPPSIGGIQTYAYQLHAHLSARRSVRLVALRQDSLLHLLWFLPRAYLTALLQLLFLRREVVYFNDGVISVLAPFLRLFSRARFVVTVHGLEMTFSHPVFSRLVRLGVATCGRVVAVSKNTRDAIVRVGISAERIQTIYQGIAPPVLPEDRHREVRAAFEARHNIRFGQDPVLLNYGRQVRRKGLAEFVEKAVPFLRPGIRVFIGGRGPELPRIRERIRTLGLQDRVTLLGWLDDETQTMLRNEADLFLMPNIHLADDLEGFGITPLECLYAGLPVVAFPVDALRESLREASFLVPEGSYPAFVEAIHHYLDLPPNEKQAAREAARAYVRREYTWDRTTEAYLNVFET